MDDKEYNINSDLDDLKTDGEVYQKLKDHHILKDTPTVSEYKNMTAQRKRYSLEAMRRKREVMQQTIDGLRGPMERIMKCRNSGY